MQKVISYRPRVDHDRLATLRARATAELENWTPKTVVVTRTPLLVVIRKYRGGCKGKPVRDDRGVRYDSATAAANLLGIRAAQITEAARSEGRRRCMNRLWWYV